jgi:stage II sporulation protein P
MSETWQKKNYQSNIPVWFTYGTLGVFLAIMGAVGVFAFHSAGQILWNSGRISKVGNGFIRLDTQSSRFILCSGIPALERSAGEDDPFRLFQFDWTGIYWNLATNVRQATPREILKTQFPILALVKPLPPPPALPVKIIPPVKNGEIRPEELTKPLELAAEPEVLIYHTHTSESYIPVCGKDHCPNKKGDIVRVGELLQKTLEAKYKIKTIHNETIHDNQYPFSASYDRSQITLKKYLAEYPSLKLVIDMHRDATPGINAVCAIKGEKTATILIVVGSDKMGLSHPNWKKNHAFALKIAETMNLYYPGLNSGVIVAKARYNQHLHPHALIFEFGDQNSTWDQVSRSVERFAEILAITLRAKTLPE